MLLCDLNCDMGEGIGHDEALMPWITSANIACGFHAGNDDIIKTTILLAKKHGVNIGAHPSFFDRENFGRTEINMPAGEVAALVAGQLYIINELCIFALIPPVSRLSNVHGTSHYFGSDFLHS